VIEAAVVGAVVAVVAVVAVIVAAVEDDGGIWMLAGGAAHLFADRPVAPGLRARPAVCHPLKVN
jgi:hypothetical protein